MKRVALTVLVLLAAACVGDPPRIPAAAKAKATPAPIVPITADAPALPAPAASPGAPEAWQHVAQQLEAENHQLTAERDYWKGEAERYQQGLQRAIDELNRQASDGAARERAAELRGALQAQPPPEQAHVWAGAPMVQVIGTDVLVTGTLYNTSGVEASGVVSIDLVLDGRVINHADLPIQIGARADVPYSQQFPMNDEGTFSARASFKARR